MGASPRDREMCLVQAVAVWKSSCALKDCFDTRRAKMEEDPHKIPALGQEDHGDFRARFVDAHPDSVLTNKNEPHRRFVERLNRDFTVNGCVPFYEVGEICRKRGEYSKADAAYREASRHGRTPEPGLALLRLAQRRHQAADASIRRALVEARRRFTRNTIVVSRDSCY